MFFYISKIFGTFIQPLNFFIAILVIIFAISWQGLGIFSRRAILIFCIALGLCGFTQLPDYLIYTLERDYPAVEKLEEGFTPVGIIVLGGSILTHKQMKNDWYHLGEASERMIEGIALARKYPKAVLVYSGGDASIAVDGGVEAHGFANALRRFAPIENQLILETKSRNTWQNAIFTKQKIVQFKRGKWMLVTSAYHMKRSLGVFKKAGIDVQPWPTDFRANRIKAPWLSVRSLTQLAKLRTYLHEVIGIQIYGLTGRL